MRWLLEKTSGSQGALLDYSPYGVQTVHQASVPSDFGYTGHYTNAKTGLVLAPYRAYSPLLGRWISRDPIEEEGGINLYAYVGNGPTGAIDPLGLDVFFNEENEIGGHAWTKIGGDTPTGGKRTYGAYPNGDIFGKPCVIQNPDPHTDDDDFSYERYKTTPEDEDALENWIKKNSDINDYNSKRNPNYNLIGNDCRSFRNDLRKQLEKIIKSRGGKIEKSKGEVPKSPK